MGVAPNDIVPFIIQERTNYQYKWIRIGLDSVLFVIGGVLLKGVYGIGTIISLLLTGPFIHICLPYGEKLVSLIIKDDFELESKTAL